MTGIHSARELRESGLSHAAIEKLVTSGAVTRIRRGWYAVPGAHPAVVAAVATGGRLTCVSALRHAGAWVMPHSDLHVRVARGVSLGAAAGRRIHWTDDGMRDDLVDPPARALEVAVACLDLRAAVVVTDSLLNRGIVRVDEVERILLATPRGRAIAKLVDGRAESGIETIPRLALRSRNIRARPQVVIPGIGRVDLLIGDRLVLEVDGREWHGDFERDRARDRALVARGYLVLRASYRQVMDEWPEIEAQILAIVAERRHRWARNPTGEGRERTVARP